MSSLTKKAIIDYTIKLAEQKPINKIKIRDIVDGCGITRNTFYYHFHDLLDVFDAAVDEEFKRIVSGDESSEQAVISLVEFAVKSKKVWRNLYNAYGHEEFSRFVMARLHSAIAGYISSDVDVSEISDEDLEIVCGFFEEALFGVMLRWIKSPKEDTPEKITDFVSRIRKLFAGVFELINKNSQKEH